MITYYRDRAIEVTSETLEVGGRVYPLAQLARVWHRRGARSWGALAGRGALGAIMLGPLVAAAVGILIAVSLHTQTTATIAIVGVSVLIGLAAGPVADLALDRVDRSYDRGSHSLELWALVGGAPVMLLQTGNAQRFGQIYRALQRALEQGVPTPLAR